MIRKDAMVVFALAPFGFGTPPPDVQHVGQATQLVAGPEPGASSAAAEIHPIDARLAAAIEADGSTAGMLAATRRAQGEWEREIRRLLRELALNLPADSWRSVQASQQAWAAYRDRETETLERVYSTMEGSMYRVLAAGDALEMHRSRARQLATYLALLEPG